MSSQNRLLRHRRVATGESHQEAVSALQRTVAGLSPANWEKGAGWLVPPARETVEYLDVLREAALPAATHFAQAELEAGILEAASDSINHLHNRPTASLLRQARVIAAVSPLPEKLMLHVVPHALGPLITELIPTRFDDAPGTDEVHGVPGLRYAIGRRHVRLYLVDHPKTTRVDLLNVTRTQWKAALAYRAAFRRDPVGACLAARHPHSLAPEENMHLAHYRRVYGPAELASAVLRRIGLFREALWLKVWPDGPDHLHVEWPGDTPTRRAISMHLADGPTAIPNAILHSFTEIEIDRSPAHPGVEQPSRHQPPARPSRRQTLRLRRTSFPRSDDSDLMRNFRRHARPEWDVWQQAVDISIPRSIPETQRPR